MELTYDLESRFQLEDNFRFNEVCKQTANIYDLFLLGVGYVALTPFGKDLFGNDRLDVAVYSGLASMLISATDFSRIVRNTLFGIGLFYPDSFVSLSSFAGAALVEVERGKLEQGI